MRRKAVIAPSVRLQVIQRDNGRCRGCGICDEDSLQADHIIPESRGGNGSLDNLQALCGVCNNRKGNTDIGELPIRERIEGFGDKSIVLSERTRFLEMVSDARKREIEHIRAKIRAWRNEGIRELIIRNRLGKMVDARRVDSLLR